MSEPNMSEGNGTDPAKIPDDRGEEHVDGCVEDVALGELEATEDFELPPARGGVERPLATQT
ncbi:MAG TPA: hypothetical protein VF650_02275 [Allosphingosinicella sp.]